MTIAALAAGDQVLIVRKGGIGEKRFELPHPRFYLFPTYAHQRPELVKPEGRARFADPLAQREEPERAAAGGLRRAALRPPDRRPGRAGGDRPPAHPRADLRRGAPALAAQAPALGGGAARVWSLPRAAGAGVRTEHGGCVSWVELPGGRRRPRKTRRPALGRGGVRGGGGRRRGGPRGRRGHALMRAHVLVCRGPDCASRGAQDVYTAMACARSSARGLSEEVVQSQSGCIGPLCGGGPGGLLLPDRRLVRAGGARRCGRDRGARPGARRGRARAGRGAAGGRCMSPSRARPLSAATGPRRAAA